MNRVFDEEAEEWLDRWVEAKRSKDFQLADRIREDLRVHKGVQADKARPCFTKWGKPVTTTRIEKLPARHPDRQDEKNMQDRRCRAPMPRAPHPRPAPAPRGGCVMLGRRLGTLARVRSVQLSSRLPQDAWRSVDRGGEPLRRPHRPPAPHARRRLLLRGSALPAARRRRAPRRRAERVWARRKESPRALLCSEPAARRLDRRGAGLRVIMLY